ncbi:extracellular solute-binding protein [Clostridium sp. D33t1_170424_F3]|uniref:extracellular solute-binding protein n=1 Tax=Clostridium sp. D33t1_170424_F3 TaxID=2787099 RepID=UPI0018ABE0B1|nr:extracellular solute-binding protein [Clostridium sp. D33t1_170424_F3]
MKLQKSLCTLLSLLLIGGIFSGCNSGTPENGNTPAPAMGRYVEKEIALPESKAVINALFYDGSENLTVYATLHPENEPEAPGLYRYTKSADGEWAKEAVEWLKGYTNATLAPDGKGGFYAVAHDKENQLRLLHTADGNTAEQIPVPSWDEPAKNEENEGGVAISGSKSVDIGDDGIVTKSDTGDAAESDQNTAPETRTVGEELMPISLDVLENGDLLLGDYSAYYRYTPTGEKVREYKVQSSGAVTDGKSLYTLDYEGSMTQYSLEDGSQVRSLASPSSGYGPLTSDAEGDLYYCNSNGIQRLTPGGTVWETIVDGSLTSLTSPSVTPTGLYLDGNGGFYVSVYVQSIGSKLFHYTYSEDTPTVPDTELTVYSLRELPTVRQAISAFQSSHANVHVNYRVGLPEGNDNVTASDVVRSLNTEILAGKGPDVLILDGLPVDSYIEKGVLADLSGLLSGADLLSNVADTYQKKGKTYVLPARFTVPVLIGDKDAISGIHQLSDLSTENEDKPLMMVSEPKELLELLASTSASGWIQDSTLNTQALIQFLTEAKATFAANDRQKWKPDGSGGGMAIMTDGGSYSFNSMGMSYLNGESHMYPADMNTLLALPGSAGSMGGKQDTNTTLGLLPGQMQNVYIPRVLAGVNAAGGQQELAQQFIQTMLSTEVQNYTFTDGLPVNNASMQKEIASAEEMADHMGYVIPIDFTDFLSQLSTPSVQDSILMDAVLTEGTACLKGEKSPEEAAAEIEKQVRLYLAE